jgi:hypothetical protein
MITKNNTYVSVLEDNELTKMTEAKFNKLVKDATDANKAAKEGEALTLVPEAAKQQTFAKHEAETLVDAQALVPDEKVLVTYFNRGYSLAEETEIKDRLEDATFTPVAGIFDLTPFMQTLTVRVRTKKALTQEDLIASLKSLPKEQIQAILMEFADALTA